MAHDNVIGILDDIVSHGIEEENNGSVESPVGYFALIEIPDGALPRFELLTEMYDGDAADITPPESGWYVFRQDSDGHKRYEGPDSEDEARAAYNELADAYDRWSHADTI